MSILRLRTRGSAHLVSVKRSEVENRNLDRRRPEIAVLIAKEKPMETPGFEIRPGDDDHTVLADGPHQLLLGFRVGDRAGGQRRGENNRRPNL